MQEEKLTTQLRPIVARYLLPILLWTGFSANTITVLNFFVFCLPACWFILKGHNILALVFCMLSTLVDFVDGEVAKAHGGSTPLGAWLDTSLDWLWQLLILGAITCSFIEPHWIMIGTWALIVVVLSNYLSSQTLFQLDNFPYVMKYFLFFGLLFNCIKIAIYFIAIFYTIKVFRLGYNSIKERQ